MDEAKGDTSKRVSTVRLHFRGPFPIDALRRVRAFPSSETDTQEIERSRRFGADPNDCRIIDITSLDSAEFVTSVLTRAAGLHESFTQIVDMGTHQETVNVTKNDKLQALITKKLGKSLADAAGDDANDALNTATGRQLVKLVQKPLVKWLSSQLAPGDKGFSARLGRFLSSPVGSGALKFASGVALMALPQYRHEEDDVGDVYPKNRFTCVVDALRRDGLADVADALGDAALATAGSEFGPLLQKISALTAE